MFTHRSWKWIVVALVATGLLLFAAPPVASSGGSPLGRYLYDNGFVSMHVDNNGHNQAIVRVSINGAGATLVLDTGCGRTCLTDYFARNLKLDVQKGDPMVGVGGKVAGGFASLHSFSFGNTAINSTNTIRVLPPRTSVTQDGILGYDYMRLNSVILPVGADYFLYRPTLEPPVELDSFLKASGYQPIPLIYGEGGLRAEGSLDGHPFVAVVDCGANFTMFDSNFVQTTVGAYVAKSRLVSWGIDGHPMYVGIFNADKLTFGALTFPPTKTTTANGTTLHAIHAQALLGYDLLATHHAIIDMGHGVLWMK
jgi:Aspartyl protease